MNAPAKRFSLQRLLTAPAPAPEPVVVKMPDPLPPPPPAPVAIVAPAVVEPTPLHAVPPSFALREAASEGKPARTPRTAPDEPSHPKKKRSYSVDMQLCEDLEILSWYLARSSSSVVEELIRKHLQHNKSVLQKAREVRAAR